LYEHFYGLANLSWLGYVIVTLLFMHVTLIAVTLYYHRDQAHRSVDLHPHAHWYVPAIRELAARADFRDEPRWLARTLWPSITSAQAKRAIAALLELGLLARDQDGRIRQAEPLVETPDGALGHHVVDFHREMMRLASEALERVPREQREIASLTLCLSPARALELKAEIQQLERQWLQRYGSEDAVQVVQLNVQLFPLSRGKE
jgi:uncharacterized protein (TIGR02147 family)